MIASISDGGLALLKKVPLLGDYIRYQEGIERQDKAIDERIANEYKILNDPIVQAQFVQSFEPGVEREAVIGHILDTKARKQSNLNIAAVLKLICEQAKDVKREEVDEAPIHPDWWLLWFDRAKMTSDPMKQEVFARAMIEETKSAGSVSPRFIRVLADLSVPEIQSFADVADCFAKEGFLVDRFSMFGTRYSVSPLNLYEQQTLANAGLVTYHDGGLYFDLHPTYMIDQEHFFVRYRRSTLVIQGDATTQAIHFHSRLSPEGIVLRALLGESKDTQNVEKVAMRIAKNAKLSITLHENQEHSFAREPFASFSAEKNGT